MRVLGGDYLPGAAAGERGDYLASVLCAGVLHPGYPRRADAALLLGGRADRGDHGAYLRRAVGEGHHYRDGGRLGDEDLGEEASPALVP